jgi:Tfp pilus assembly protein PilN
MFRVNLYTERQEKRRLARRKAAQAAVIAVILGVNAVLVGAYGLGASLLEERRDALADEISRLETMVARSDRDDTALEQARELHGIRLSRLEWSPLLAAVSESLPPQLVLDELQGQAAQNRVRAHLEFTGVTRSAAGDLTSVSEFVGALRADPRVTDGFPEISLGSIRSGSGDFQVYGDPARAKE